MGIKLFLIWDYHIYHYCGIDLHVLFFFLLFFRESKERWKGEREREREINSPFHLFMHSLLDSCVRPDQELNLLPWSIRMIL